MNKLVVGARWAPKMVTRSVGVPQCKRKYLEMPRAEFASHVLGLLAENPKIEELNPQLVAFCKSVKQQAEEAVAPATCHT